MSVQTAEMPAMPEQVIQELLVLLKLWHGNYMEAMGDTLVTITTQHMGTMQLSIRSLKLMTAEEALKIMGANTNDNKKAH